MFAAYIARLYLPHRESGDRRIQATEKYMANPMQQTVQHNPSDTAGGGHVTPVSIQPDRNRLIAQKIVQQSSVDQKPGPVQLQQALVNSR